MDPGLVFLSSMRPWVLVGFRPDTENPGNLPLQHSYIGKASPSRAGNRSREPAAVMDCVIVISD